MGDGLASKGSSSMEPGGRFWGFQCLVVAEPLGRPRFFFLTAGGGSTAGTAFLGGLPRRFLGVGAATSAPLLGSVLEAAASFGVVVVGGGVVIIGVVVI